MYLFQLGSADPNNNHVAVMTNGTGQVNPTDAAHLLGVTTAVPDFRTQTPLDVRVRYVGGVLNVYVGDLTTPDLTVNYDLESLGLTNGNAFLGFTGATGGGFAQQEVLSWVTAVPEPATVFAVIAFTGCAGMVAWRQLRRRRRRR